MGEVANLNIKRSNAADDCRLASVTDRLEEALEDSRDGRWAKCLLIMYRETDNTFCADLRLAGCSKLEARGLMFTAVKDEIVE